jgi:aminoglycoside/choline kinase family phosphotransferase
MPGPQPVLTDPLLACRSWTPLVAEASSRRYVRLEAPRCVDAPSAVLMLFATSTLPDEVARVERVTRLMAAAGVPVPEIYRTQPGAGWILQEDLGDVTLASVVNDGQDATEAYAEALGVLPRLARMTLDTSPPPLDGRRLAAELQLFAKSALLPGADTLVEADLQRIVARCVSQPQQLCHRDYHARNLMLTAGAVRIIDHQDAMAGPRHYDRASLAYDPYVDLEDDVRDALAGAADGAVAVQRLCKAIGTYASKGGHWARWIAPAARQAGRLARRDRLAVPELIAVLDDLAR